MPPFPERESNLLTSLDRKHDDTQDSRTWVIGGKEANRDRNIVRAKSLNKKAEGGILHKGPGASPTLDGNPTHQTGQLQPQPDALSHDLIAPFPEKTTSGVSLSAAAIHVVRNDAIDSDFMELLYNYEGVLYDSDFLRVVVKSEYHGPLGRLLLQIFNKVASATLTSFSATIDSSDEEALNITFPQMMSNSKIVGGESVQQSVHVECRGVYSEPPTLRMSYIAGSHQTLALRFPVLLSKFLEPVEYVDHSCKCIFLNILSGSHRRTFLSGGSRSAVRHGRLKSSSRSALKQVASMDRRRMKSLPVTDLAFYRASIRIPETLSRRLCCTCQ